MNIKQIVQKIAGGRVRDISRYFSASLVPMIISLVLNPFIAVNMSKTDFALTGYYTSFNLLLLPLVSFSLIQYYNKSYFNVTSERREKILNTIVSFQLVFGLIMLILFAGGLYLYRRSKNIELPFTPYAIILLSSVYLAQFTSNFLVKLKFESNSTRYFRVSVTNVIIHVISVTVFVIGWKLHALGYCIATIAGPVGLLYISLKETLSKFELDHNVLKVAIPFIWPIVLANLMEYVYVGVDRSFLIGLHNTEALGLYNIAVTMGNYVTVFYTALNQTFQPDIFRAVSEKNVRRTFGLIGRVQLLNLVPILLFIIFAPSVVKILTFGRYVDATPYARIIALKGIFAACYFSFSSVIIAAGLSKITLLNKTIGTVCVFVMYYYLINRYEYMGAAWGQALSYVAMIIFSGIFIYFKRKQIFS